MQVKNNINFDTFEKIQRAITLKVDGLFTAPHKDEDKPLRYRFSLPNGKQVILGDVDDGYVNSLLLAAAELLEYESDKK